MEDSTIAQPRTIADLKPKMLIQGVVKETHMYGAVIDIGLEQDGLVHISQLAKSRTNAVTDVVQPGDQVKVWVTQVDTEKGRIGLSMVKPADVTWNDLKAGQSYTGTVTRMENYGVFVDIGAERAGLLHVREMSSGYVRHPSELVQMGDEIEIRILKVDKSKRRIDLSMVTEDDYVEEFDDDEEDAAPVKTAMEIALERARDEQAPAQARRQKKQGAPDLSGREAILARTLKQHGQD